MSSKNSGDKANNKNENTDSTNASAGQFILEFTILILR